MGMSREGGVNNRLATVWDYQREVEALTARLAEAERLLLEWQTHTANGTDPWEVDNETRAFLDTRATKKGAGDE